MQRWVIWICLTISLGAGCSMHASSARQQPATPSGSAWEVGARIVAGNRVGPAICYSGYREGQSPERGTYPSREETLEDLRILEKQWRLIRIYGSGAYAEQILNLIREQKINLKVMLGAWLAKEPGNESFNAAQVETCIRLANEFTDIVFAVCVGNEVLIHWTLHPVPEEAVLRYVREVRSRVRVPITLADNYALWIADGERVARELDFLTVHSYPVYERKGIDEALSYTIENYQAVKAAFPEKTVVMGEAGWPTYTRGNLHVSRAGNEQHQKRYYEELSNWAEQHKVNVFYFGAFDEPWKGPGTEGHWGLFSVDRKAKLAMLDPYPDLRPTAPTSPSYDATNEKPQDKLFSILFPQSDELRITNGTINFLGPGLLRNETQHLDEHSHAQQSVRVPFSGEDWAGVFFHFDPVDVSAKSGITITLQVPDSVAKLELRLEAPLARSRSVNIIEYQDATDAEGWTDFHIPFSRLGGLDLTQLTVIGLWNPKDREDALVKGELHVKEARFY